jgi:hypothetical protein
MQIAAAQGAAFDANQCLAGTDRGDGEPAQF